MRRPRVEKQACSYGGTDCEKEDQSIWKAVSVCLVSSKIRCNYEKVRLTKPILLCKRKIFN